MIALETPNSWPIGLRIISIEEYIVPSKRWVVHVWVPKGVARVGITYRKRVVPVLSSSVVIDWQWSPEND